MADRQNEGGMTYGYGELLITSAAHGGYTVRATNMRRLGDPVELTDVVFAGSADDALAFIRVALVGPTSPFRGPDADRPDDGA